MSQATQTPHSHGAVVPAASRAEQFASFDVAAFEIPGGREEIWRFTPMKRLRGLHDGTAVADGELSVTVDGADVTVETVGRDDERLRAAGSPARPAPPPTGSPRRRTPRSARPRSSPCPRRSRPAPPR